MITPLKHRVLVQRDAPKQETEGGLVIPELAQKKECFGTVLSVGSTADRDLQPGQRIYFGLHDGFPISPEFCDGKENCLMIATYLYLKLLAN